jgi:hypothetical protein
VEVQRCGGLLDGLSPRKSPSSFVGAGVQHTVDAKDDGTALDVAGLPVVHIGPKAVLRADLGHARGGFLVEMQLLNAQQGGEPEPLVARLVNILLLSWGSTGKGMF